MGSGKAKKGEPNFFEDVHAVVMLIPKGRVTNYGAIARYLGTAMSARMVGWAMNAAHANKKIPATGWSTVKGCSRVNTILKLRIPCRNGLRRRGLKSKRTRYRNLRNAFGIQRRNWIDPFVKPNLAKCFTFGG